MVTTILTLAYWPSPHGLARNLATTGNETAVETTILPAQEATQDALTQRKLAQPVSVEYADKPLHECLSNFADLVGFQSYIDLKIADAGIEPDTLVNVKLKEVPADMVLELMLRPLGLEYMVKNGVIIVTTPEEMESPENLALRVYDPVAYGIDWGANGDELVDVVTSTVNPCSWDSAGGAGTIQPFNKLLVIRQTVPLFRQVDDLFVKLGEASRKGIAKRKQ
jgi:hypothetical protein